MKADGMVAPVLAACALLSAPSLGYAQSYETRTTGHVTLQAAGGATQTVVQLNVPAGTWVAFAKGTAVNWGDADYVRCGIRIDGTPADGTTTMVGEADGMPAVAAFSSVYRFRATRATTVSLVCLHDAYNESIYIDPGASLTVLSGS
jgi:hypothetical protein